ncbi:MAG TPA: alpha/beta fold hydrolase [Candidatus Baltobacteraceae bacterium]|nr:alpha/beta fold hydrolase [Candidatus Baltobacteraceae bacterium]
MIAAAALAALLTRTVSQSDVFRPPAPPPVLFAQMARRLRAKTVTFESGGVTLRGFWFPATRADAKFVLVFYGNAELAPYESDRLTWLRTIGYNAVCFDYRGYGYSGGVPDAETIRRDSVALYDYVTGGLERSHEPAFVYGISLGTQFAIHVAAQRRVRGLLLQSPAASADEEMKWYAQRFLGIASPFITLVPSAQVRSLFQGAKEIADSKAPLIVVHGAQDELIPIAQGREVFSAAPLHDKRFIEIPDAGHGNIRFDRPPAGPPVRSFLAAHS